jgi:hypothetical protein
MMTLVLLAPMSIPATKTMLPPSEQAVGDRR